MPSISMTTVTMVIWCTVSSLLLLIEGMTVPEPYHKSQVGLFMVLKCVYLQCFLWSIIKMENEPHLGVKVVESYKKTFLILSIIKVTVK